MNFDLRKKIFFLVVGTVLIILFYQLALYKDPHRLYNSVPSFFFKKVESGESEWDNKHLEGKDVSVHHFEDGAHHVHDDTSQADILKTKIKVLCWVMTSPDNHRSKAIHVLETWGRRCNKILFATEAETGGKDLPLLIVNTTSGRDHLTAKTMQTFDHLYRNFLDEFDWFLKADDDTYVIVENMRYFLSSQDPTKAIFFGHHFRPYVSQGYFSGGAGYILSKEALRRFGERRPEECHGDEGAEDVEMGLCMQKVGVITGDSRDALGRSRFHCFNPETHIHGGYPDWYKQYDKYGAHKGIESISDYAITFHYVSVEQLYNLEFFIYHLRPYGIISGEQDLNVHNVHTHKRSTYAPLTSLSSLPSAGQVTSKKMRRRRRKATTTLLLRTFE